MFLYKESLYDGTQYYYDKFLINILNEIYKISLIVMNYMLLMFSLISGRLRGADLRQNGWCASNSLPNRLQNK